MDIQQKQSQIEEELLAAIIRHLEQHSLDVSQASALAREFLTVLPFQNQEDLLAKLKGLSTTSSEVKQIYIRELSDEMREKEQQAIEKMNSAIKQGNIEHAITVAKSLQTQTP